MKYGIFDHMDDAAVPLYDQYEDRLRFLETCDSLNFYCYHLAEHHGTPLGYAPSPSVFLASAIQRTKRLRVGPLLYVLPLYHPVRAYEEICMLDQLSGGRLEVGMGRGSMPYEISMYGIDPATAQSRYQENFEIIRQAFSSDEVAYAGQGGTAARFPVRIRPFQRPHPPLWYATLKPDSAAWAARNSANVMTLGSIETARAVSSSFRTEWKLLGHALDCLPHIGITRHVVVADTDSEAIALGRRAYKRWREAMEFLWKESGLTFTVAAVYPETFDELLTLGNGIAGSPKTVRDTLNQQVGYADLNYVACQIFFGDMSLEEASYSARLFAEYVCAPSDVREASPLSDSSALQHC